MNNKKAKLIISTIIAFVVGYFLIVNINFAKLINIILNVNKLLFILAIITYILLYFVRTIKFKILLVSKNMPISKLFYIMPAHNMFLNILPARLGELSFIHYTKKNISVGKSSISLLISRYIEIIAILCLFIFSVFLFKKSFMLPKKMLYAIFLLVGVMLFLSFIIFQNKKIFEFVDRFFYNFRKIGPIEKVRLILLESKDHLNSISWKICSMVLLISLLTYSIIYLQNFIILRALGFDVSFFAAVLGATITMVLSMIPIQGFGGIGTVEGGWVTALLLLGFRLEEALIMSVSLHITQLFIIILLGLISIAKLNMINRQEFILG